MAIAWFLALIAIAGSWGGAHLVRAEQLSESLAAAGGGLLLGISLFWLVPEISESSGKIIAISAALLVAATLWFLDWILSHSGKSAHRGVFWPILAAAAIHALLDGWSVRNLSAHPFTDVTVSVGLALHKVPEGVALGWVSRRALASPQKAFLASSGVEIFTVLGAFIEPAANASGVTRFGQWWTVSILSIVAGGFLFLGLHAMLPIYRKRSALLVFLTTLTLIAALTLFHVAL